LASIQPRGNATGSAGAGGVAGAGGAVVLGAAGESGAVTCVLAVKVLSDNTICDSDACRPDAA
jgi:hypothetical protein